MKRSALPLLVVALGICTFTKGQEPVESALYQDLQRLDSLLFDAAFTRCDPGTVKALISEDFEFYHDKGGATLSKAAFMAPVVQQCERRNPAATQPSKRILLAGSLQVFPLYNKDSLYGALQQGIHRFESLNEVQEYEKGDIARFSHLWIRDKGAWKLARVLSYDHRPSGQ